MDTLLSMLTTMVCLHVAPDLPAHDMTGAPAQTPPRSRELRYQMQAPVRLLMLATVAVPRAPTLMRVTDGMKAFRVPVLDPRSAMAPRLPGDAHRAPFWLVGDVTRKDLRCVVRPMGEWLLYLPKVVLPKPTYLYW